MARRRVVVMEVDEAADQNARRRARHAWMRGRFGTGQHPPFIAWRWPTDDALTGVELLEAVASDYRAAGIPVPIGGYVGEPFLRPGERHG